jgi:hypothetical protein
MSPLRSSIAVEQATRSVKRQAPCSWADLSIGIPGGRTHRAHGYCFRLCWCGFFAFLMGRATASSAEMKPLQIEGAARHPTVFLTPDEIAHGRANVARYPWAHQTADLLIAKADQWVARDDAWLRHVVPARGAAFAYGTTGCPVCGQFLGAWGQGSGSFDHPGTLLCPNGHRIPDAAHPDDGSGYVASGGRVHYIVGTYNAWVVETLTFDALDSLAYAYSLTGEERYAAKASVILDAIAAIYPADHKGAWDYPNENLSGRLDRPWYQASRALVHYVDQYDQIFNSPALDLPSTTAGLTRRRNIEDNLLKDGGAYCVEGARLGRLHNGTADYARGALAVGVCLGIPEYVRFAVDSPFGIRALLANSVGRDGDYAEITALYSDHARELYFTFAEPLLHYRGSAFPSGLDLYKDIRFRKFLEPHNLPLTLAGHMPRYGDSQPDLVWRPVPARPFDRSDYDFLEKLYARTADSGIGQLLAWIADGKFEWLRSPASDGDPTGQKFTDRRISAGISLYREPGDLWGSSFTDRMWLLFNAGDPPMGPGKLSPIWKRRLLATEVQGQKGIAVLRAGEGADAQGLMLRYGPALNHAHLDDLNVNYVALGRELTYDLGYSRTASTQTQVGWAKQTASHNVVVVNEHSQRGGGASGGSLWLLADTPELQAVEASSELAYSGEGVSVYRRTSALIGEGATAYWVDFFRVRGGHQHDWMFHSIGPDLKFAGVTFLPSEKGSLAGPDICWSDKVGRDGDVRTGAKPTAGLTLDYILPPGNGYGFLGAPAHGRAVAAWSADWKVDAQTHLRLHAPTDPTVELISAIGCGLYPDYPQVRQVVMRRRGEALSSEFAVAVEPYRTAGHIDHVERLSFPHQDHGIEPVGLKIVAIDGGVDRLYSAPDSAEHQADGRTFAGRLILERQRAGELESLVLIGGRGFSNGGWTVQPETDGWRGSVDAMALQTDSFTTRVELPIDGRLIGAMITFSNPAYSRNTAFRIRRIERDGEQIRVTVEGGFILGVGSVTEIPDRHTIRTAVTSEYVVSDTGTGLNSYFRGKRIINADGAHNVIRGARLAAANQPMELSVDSTKGFAPGQRFEYTEVQPGDAFEILATCVITRTGPHVYRVESPGVARITAPARTTLERAAK